MRIPIRPPRARPSISRAMPAGLALAFASALTAVSAVPARTPTAPLAQQSAQQAPVFRSGTAVVPLSVSVVDRKGKPVTDLSEKDFSVSENGRPREIVNFHKQDLAAPGARIGAAGLEPANHRTFVIVLLPGRIQQPGRGVDGAISFVRERVLPNDRVAVMAFHRVTEFTTNHSAVLTALERYRSAHEELMHELRLYVSSTRMGSIYRGGPAIPAALLDKVDDTLFGAEPRQLRLLGTADRLFGMDRAVPVNEKPWQRQTRFAELSDRLGRMNINLRDLTIFDAQLKLLAGVEYLRYQEGEKHLVFIGASPISLGRAGTMAQRATDARVKVHYIFTAGMAPPPFRSSGCAGCRELVELTGGYYTSLEYAPVAMARVEEESRFFYLIGYQPLNADLDGSYRDIKVRVSRDDVEVRYRHGYFASPEPDPEALREAVLKSAMAAVGAHDLEATDIPLEVEAVAGTKGTSAAEMRVTISVPASALELIAERGRRTGQLEVRIFCGDARERVIGSAETRLNIDVEESTYTRWMDTGFQRSFTIPIKGQARFVKVAVFDLQSGLAGSRMVTVNSK